MPSVALASRTFASDDQVTFAGLTGDFNPIHLDPSTARKTQAGTAIVHGIHAILWSLDKLVELGAVTEEIVSLNVQFRNFIPVGKQMELKLLSRDAKSVRLELCLGRLTTVTLVIAFGTRKGTRGIDLPDTALRKRVTDKPANFVRIEEIAKLTGWMDTLGRTNGIQRHFPYACSAIGSYRVASIALLSTLVGMICPGLHSLFGGFAVELVDDSHSQDGIRFQVGGADERFRMVRMSVSGPGICGSVCAFLRRPPIAQASLTEIMRIVSPTEFAGSVALIIGGSRGLGALTAKILAAGGGRVIFTYATGRTDAAELTEEIWSKTASGICQALQYNVHEEAATQLKNINTDVTHLYYFATSNIARQKEEPFVMSLFDEFVQMYVRGFYDCCHYLGEHGSGALTAFYPSSIFVESNPSDMIEYCMAKMAGEMLCANMNRTGSRVHVVASRLPRLLTDQTATLLPVGTEDPLKIMLPEVRKVQSSRVRHHQLDGAPPSARRSVESSSYAV
jgi:acyl dehydratase/NAD(P)-dependent dehydrogenase (short-subunit alcohol dehydrogenase family)